MSGMRPTLFALWVRSQFLLVSDLVSWKLTPLSGLASLAQVQIDTVYVGATAFQRGSLLSPKTLRPVAWVEL